MAYTTQISVLYNCPNAPLADCTCWAMKTRLWLCELLLLAPLLLAAAAADNIITLHSTDGVHTPIGGPTAAAALLTPPAQQHHQQHDQSQQVRRLLQSGSAVVDACGTEVHDAVDGAAVSAIAAQLLGDPQLQLQAVRYTGACQALGLASLEPSNALSAVLTTAVVLSTGAAADSVKDVNGQAATSTAYGTPTPDNSGFPPGCYDAAILELDIYVSPSTPPGSQLSFNYMFGSEEYGGRGGSRRPDAVIMHARPTGAPAATSLALLPGGGVLAGAGARPPPQVAFYDNAAQGEGKGAFATALDGFTQVRVW